MSNDADAKSLKFIKKTGEAFDELMDRAFPQGSDSMSVQEARIATLEAQLAALVNHIRTVAKDGGYVLPDQGEPLHEAEPEYIVEFLAVLIESEHDHMRDTIDAYKAQLAVRDAAIREAMETIEVMGPQYVGSLVIHSLRDALGEGDG